MHFFVLLAEPLSQGKAYFVARFTLFLAIFDEFVCRKQRRRSYLGAEKPYPLISHRKLEDIAQLFARYAVNICFYKLSYRLTHSARPNSVCK